MSDHDYDAPRSIDELALRRVPARAGQLTIGELPCAAPVEQLVPWLANEHTVVEQLYNATRPLPGRDGWRIDADGHEWFSSAWIGRHA